MNWIEPDDIPLAIRDFFYNELMPLATDLRNSGKSFFPVKADPEAQSYYSKRKKTTMSPEDFEIAGRVTVDSFEKALIDMWTAQGNSELTAFAPTLSRLARSLYCVEELNEAVSPFIYVMF